MNIIDRFKSGLSPEADIRQNVPLKDHTTFKVGGPADIFIETGCEADIVNAFEIINDEKIPYLIMGNGSNLLITDKGFRGAVVSLKQPDFINIEGNIVEAGAGALLSSAAAAAARNSLTGLEFAGGIPGSVGGAVYMNAGAYGGEMARVLKSVKAVMPDGEIKTFDRDQLCMGYRHSVFTDNKAVIISAVMELEQGDKSQIDSLMKELSRKRSEKQPLNYPSAGSTFKRPEGYFAAKLIEDAGLKGLRAGGAQVSEKHSGFIVNAGGATASDILDLINIVRLRVKDEFGVELETEVKIEGEM